jgi:hypothetical protein
MPMIRSLRTRREALVTRSAAQRAAIAAQLAPAARTLAAADRVATTLRAHPVIAAVAAAGLALIGPRSVLLWAMRVLPVYSFLRRL